MFTLRAMAAAELTDAQWLALAEFLHTVWPNPDLSSQGRAEYRNAAALGRPASEIITIESEGVLVAAGQIFGREVEVDGRRRNALALAAFAVAEELRGQGLGRQIVLEAFKRVDSGAFEFAIFQTGVPGFYEPMNCRALANRVVNSLADAPDANPFHDTHIMVYPAQTALGEGVVDMCGPGY
jgi:predicted N-acetyltransferase YhbS